MNKYLLIGVGLIVIVLYISILQYKQKEYFYGLKENDHNKIPKVVISTYHDKKKIPKKVFDNIHKYASNYKYIIFDDDDIIRFLINHYPRNVLDTFKQLKGAHKADLFRYCYLYKYGGIYLDIKTNLIKPLDSIFNKNNINLYTVLSIKTNSIYQGIIATTPNNTMFKELIEFMVTIKKPVTNYLVFTRDFYKKLQQYYTTNLVKGLNKGPYGNVYLFNEKCTNNTNHCYDGLDRYHKCCYVYDNNEKIIKTRYADYPW